MVGATGKFPHGKWHSEDEGELVLGVTTVDDKVIINFGKPTAWIGMDATTARGLAALLIEHAMTAEQREKYVVAVSLGQ